jgi:Cd2+/Zn2+-exporting ATPase
MSKACCGTGPVNPGQESKMNEVFPDSSITSFKVSGMDCADEVAAIQKSFSVPQVRKVDANLLTETVTVYHQKDLSKESMVKLINKAGLKVVTEEGQGFFKDYSTRIYLIGASGILLSLGLVLDWLVLSNSVVVNSSYGISSLLAGIIIFPKAWRSIKDFHLDMNVLMTTAVIGAFLIHEYSEAASVLFLFSLAELLEALSVSRARKAIREVLKVTPKEALVLGVDGISKSIDVNLLNINDLILVRPGDNIPIDGIISEGTTSINQASLTGESKAVDKNFGDEVYAGTLNESGAIKVKVTKIFSETKISKVISLIETAQSEKAPAQRFVDQFASIYTPAVMLLALLTAIIPPLFFEGSWEVWIYKSLVLLVIGCPCALVIATPVSVVSGLTSLARRGILVKGGVHLESLGKLQALALDKTGTVTNGTPEVAEFRLFSKLSEEEVIRLASSLESLSTHPLALAMLRFADSKDIKYEHPSDFKIISGKGAAGKLGKHMYFVGNHNLAHELGVCGPEIENYLDEMESKSMSVIVLGHKPHNDCKGEVLAIFALGDKIRSNMDKVIKSLHHAGLKSVSILSGDNQRTVDAVAKTVGIDYAKGALLPDDKVQEIKKLVSTYKYVGMVGDGVNDAPAMATATLGIAMGVVGSDTAIETADVALMNDDLSMLPKAIEHGRKVLNVIRFNIGFAIAIKAVFFILAFIGMTNLWFAVAADMGASLFVTFNALRLLKIKH